MQVWQSYLTDTGFTYPLLPVSIVLKSQITSDIDILSLLPVTIQNQVLNINKPCSVPNLIPRSIKLFLSDDSRYELNYPVPFDQQLFNSLSAAIAVRAFELVGENIKYSRLQRMLNRGS